MTNEKRLREKLLQLQDDYITFLEDCRENEIDIEFRVKDAPNSVWQDMNLTKFDIFNEVYRVKPSD